MLGGQDEGATGSQDPPEFRQERHAVVDVWPACSAKLGLTQADKSGGQDSEREDARDRQTRSDDRTESSGSDDSSSSDTESQHERNAAPGSSYTIKPGDTLSEIATANGIDGGWKALWELNRSLVGEDPNLIFPGEKLRLS